MPAPSSSAFRLDLWDAPAPAGGARVAFLADAGIRAATSVERARFLEAGRSQLAFDVLPEYHAIAALAPQQGVVRLTDYKRTAPDTVTVAIQEWRVVNRRRTVRRQVGVYRITCVPLADDLLDVTLASAVSDGGLIQWGYSATARTPSEILTDVRDLLAAAGYSWVDVGTVTPTTPVSIALEAATPRAIIDALIEALRVKGVTAEFQFTLAGDLSEYRLELVTRIAGALPALVASTDASAIEVEYDEDALEQANVIIPRGEGGADLSDLVLLVLGVDGGTGWVTLGALDGSAALVVAVDDEFNGARLYRERTGRSFAITDTDAGAMRVRLATTDFASGLAVGERVSLRASETLGGERRAFLTATTYAPAEVVSTATSPPRITTRNLAGGGNFLEAAHQYRDWALERSTLVATLPTGDFNHVAGTFVLDSAPAANPAAGDWLWFPLGGARVPLQVASYDSGTRTVTGTPRYAGHQFTESAVDVVGVKCYRPVGTPMWIQASAVTGNEFTVDAHTGPGFSSTDVLEIVQRGLGARLVTLRDPAALALSRPKVAAIEVQVSGLTNRVPNADFAAWSGGSGDPPDGGAMVSVVGTVTTTRTTDPLTTRYGGKSLKLDFAAGASGEFLFPPSDAHPVAGGDQVAAAVALLFTRFTGDVPIVVTLYTRTAGGTRAPLGEPVRVYPADTSRPVDAALKAQLDAWYDAVIANQSIAAIGAAQLQLGVARPVGASNPACTLFVDIGMLVHREGLPAAAEGGVRYIPVSEATALLTAGHEALLDRARPLVRFEGRLLDLHRLDGEAFSAHELVVGRDVSLRIPPLGVERTVRLLGVSDTPDDVRSPQVVLDRVRPQLGQLLAATLVPDPPAPIPVPALPDLVPFLEATWTRDTTAYTITFRGGPIVEYSTNGGHSWAAATSPLVITRGVFGFELLLRARMSTVGVPPKERAIGIEAAPPIVTGDPAINGVITTNHDTPCDGGGGFDLDFDTADMPGTETYDWTAEVLSGWGVGFSSDSGTAVPVGSLPVAVVLDLCPGAEVYITVVAKSGGAVIATFEDTVVIT